MMSSDCNRKDKFRLYRSGLILEEEFFDEYDTRDTDYGEYKVCTMPKCLVSYLYAAGWDDCDTVGNLEWHHR